MRSVLPSAALLAGAVLAISGCQDPISPESEGPLLHRARAAAFSAVVDNTAGIANPECITPLEDGTLVFHGCVSPQTLTGGLEGGGDAIFDGIIDAAGDGHARGTLLYSACVAHGVCGDFEGRFHGEFTGGLFTDNFRLWGRTGGVKGIHIRGTFTEQGTAPGTDIFDLVGTIRFPRRQVH